MRNQGIMDDQSPFALPEITDEDIHWASALLGLGKDAFFGKDGSDPRHAVIKSMEPMDVAACPGSGKTTLLVAKLAILAEKWRYRTRGICVLSHTNAARSEIESKLGNTNAGRRLLSYPHYVGTIHGFVNEFLAVPWLRAKGHLIKLIDNEKVESVRRDLLRHWNRFSALKTYVENNEKRQNIVAQWVVSSPDFLVLKKEGNPVFKNDCLAAGQLKELAASVFRKGFHRHDEMFTWAKDLMDKTPHIVGVMQDRFPLLFIDEAQDNNEAQSAILNRIFTGGSAAVICQRFGDSNQAIYNFAGDKGAETNAFPSDKIKRMDLPNSHRFGQTIADLANPFGLAPVPGGLKGQGPANRGSVSKAIASGAQEAQHTIFLIDPADATKILDAYGELLLETFSNQELRDGSFWAVAQVHRPKEDGKEHKAPHYIGHYWPDYDSELSKQDPKPDSFVQYVLSGMAKAKISGEASPAVEKIAEGILRLADMAKGGITLYQRRHSHRYVLQLLEGHAEARKFYDAILDRFVVKRDPPTKEMWNDTHADRRRIVRKIAESVAKSSLNGPEIEEFLAWPDEPNAPALAPDRNVRDNIYRFQKHGREVAIQVGSIHSVKGTTNTATLVLETFWQGKNGRHNLELLSPWLSKEKAGGTNEGAQQAARLKIHYVAMTRPTHLLCLAMKRRSFEKDDQSLDRGVIDELERRGWQIKCV